MSQTVKAEIMETFDKMFTAAQHDLRGTDQEILIFKATAQRWFEAGAREAAAIFYHKGRKVLDEARAEVDSNFRFLNNVT